MDGWEDREGWWEEGIYSTLWFPHAQSQALHHRGPGEIVGGNGTKSTYSLGCEGHEGQEPTHPHPRLCPVSKEWPPNQKDSTQGKRIIQLSKYFKYHAPLMGACGGCEECVEKQMVRAEPSSGRLRRATNS